MMMRMSYHVGVFLTLVFLVAVLSALGFLVPSLSRTVIEGFIYATLVVGLGLFVGNTGIVSFGHASFAMIGAYAASWFTCCTGMRQVFLPGLPDALAALTLPVPIAALIAMILTAAVAFFAGSILLRLNGVAASIGLLSFLFMVKTIYENWDGWTSGQSALVGLPFVVGLAGSALGLIVALSIATLYQGSASGLVVRSARDDEVAARSVGVRVWRERLICFVLSAAITALGGVMLGHYLGSISVVQFWLDLTFLTLAMLVVGGRETLSGAVLGAFAITGLKDGLRVLENGLETPFGAIGLPEGVQEIALALLVLVVLIVSPKGLTGGRDVSLFKR
jgi:branched-chain amino acid transport system permease protein